MLRSAASVLGSVARSHVAASCRNNMGASTRLMSSHNTGTEEEFDNRYIAYFNKPDLDGWEVRKGMNDLCGLDLVPDPQIIIAALKACRRLNEFALTVRFLEAVKNKCGPKVNEIFPYVMQEIQPTLTELGISTPEELGYDKPELGLKTVYEV